MKETNITSHNTSKDIKFLISLIIFIIFSCLGLFVWQKISFKEPVYETAGTPVRQERESKLSLSGDRLKFFSTKELIENIRQNINTNTSTLTAPSYTNSAYWIDNKSSSFVFFDIYFDTPEKLFSSNTISYRLRQRFDNKNSFEEYLEGKTNTSSLPTRLEFQAKIYNEPDQKGLINVEESRFEFRNQSSPFSDKNPAPKAPWDINEYISYTSTGVYKNYLTTPAEHITKQLKINKPFSSLEASPHLVLVTERERFHLHMNTPWGSGPNPTQTFIVTLDTFFVYEAQPFLDYLNDNNQNRAPLLGKTSEIEVEFERNVSTALDNIIEVKETPTFTDVRNAFLEDQETITNFIINSINEKGITITSSYKSKYLQANTFLDQ